MVPSRARPFVAAALIALVALLVYGQALFPPDESQRYPWSSDAWGHLIKVEYLQEQIEAGVLYPDLFPHWYNGQQMLRYYAPLPYYVLVGIDAVSDDVFVAGNWFLFFCALGGGLSVLLFSRRYGLFWATLGGVLLVLMPDNLRVAFAEGNLPRVLASALLPATFYLTLRMLTEERGRKATFVMLALLMGLIVLSHAMMGAIFGASLSLFVLVYWLTAQCSIRHVLQTVLALFAGVLLSGWWLVPSLSGGITDLNTDAVSEALAGIPWQVSLNPVARWSNPESFYLGASFILALVLVAVYWRRADATLKVLSITGLALAVLSSTLLNVVYNALPFHELFWPIRFMSVSGLMLIIVTVAALSLAWRTSGPGKDSLGRFVVAGLAILVLLDFWQSTPLVMTREAPPEIEHVAQLLRESPGWRVATADLSLLGSSPSYLFTAVGGKEQVYGWAYQGAVTSPAIVKVNQAIEEGFSTYALDRLGRMGSDDIVVLKTLPQSPYRVSQEFRTALPDAGYELAYSGGRIELYQRRGGPRAYAIPTDTFAIGSGAQNLALLFPDLIVGSETKLDEYDVEFLADFDTLVLAGFGWNDRAEAEAMVRSLAGRGKRIVIDLAGTPHDALAREPRFLDIYGERVIVSSPPSFVFEGLERTLKPFQGSDGSWQAYVPQGLDEKEVTFDLFGAEAVVVGQKLVSGGRITFLGMNLIFHSVLTGDPLAIDILEAELGLEADRRPDLETVPLDRYEATEDGFRFSVEATRTGYYLLPFAHHSGTTVYVDGQSVTSLAVDSLTLVKLPSGTHDVAIESARTVEYPVGRFATALGLMVVLGMLFQGRAFSELRKRFTFIGNRPQAATPRPSEDA